MVGEVKEFADKRPLAPVRQPPSSGMGQDLGGARKASSEALEVSGDGRKLCWHNHLPLRSRC